MFELTDLEKQILKAVSKAKLGTPTEVALYLGKDRGNVSKALKRLIANGRVRLNRPEYVVTKQARKARPR